jgi:hypothetical protein
VLRSICLGASTLLVLLAVSSTSLGSTQVKRYHAWDSDDGNPTVGSWSERHGDCNTSSYVDPRLDTWRCFVGGSIQDPCFENPTDDGELMCVESPWARRGILVRSRLDPADRFPYKAHAWAMRLSSGTRCGFVSGASAVVRGKRLNYACGRTGAAFLFGLPSHRRPTWTIIKARDPDGAGWKRTRIRAVWR